MPPTIDPSEAGDPLEALREQIRATQEAAERAMRETGRAMRGGEKPPARGYAVPRPEPEREGATPEMQAVLGLFDALRSAVPPDVRAQLAELLREILLLVRALIDWYLERVELRRSAPVEVEDIPID